MGAYHPHPVQQSVQNERSEQSLWSKQSLLSERSEQSLPSWENTLLASVLSVYSVADFV